MTGASASITMILKAHVAEFEDESVPVQVTTVLPTGKRVPDAGEQLTEVPGQLSVTVAFG